MNKIGYTVILVILGVIVLIALLMGQRSCLGAIQAWPTRVVVLSPTLTPPGPTPTPEVEVAVEATLRPEVIDQAVQATRQSWVTPSPTPCGWQGLCPLATGTATPLVTATPVVVTATPEPPTVTPPSTQTPVVVTATPSPTPVACTGTLQVTTPGGTSAVEFDSMLRPALEGGTWPAGTRLAFIADREVSWEVTRNSPVTGSTEYVAFPSRGGYELHFAWPWPTPPRETWQNGTAFLLAGLKYSLQASYTEGQTVCLAVVNFLVDP